VKHWRQAAELPGLVALSLSKTIKAYPAVGWARADQTSNSELLSDLNTLRKENETLRMLVEKFETNSLPEDATLAGLEEEFDVNLKSSYFHSVRSARGLPSRKNFLGQIVCPNCTNASGASL
jgi:hypothetical protein